MGRIVRLIVIFAVSVIVATVLASASSTIFVLGGLADLGAEIAPGEWLSIVVRDIGGMGPTYAPLAAGGLLIAFAAAWLVTKIVPGPRAIAYAIAGAVALVAIVLLMREVLGVTPISGARTALGLIGQALAGLIAGAVFAALSGRYMATMRRPFS